MNKILQTSKKLFKFTISRAFFLCLGIGLALVIYKIQSATINTPLVPTPSQSGYPATLSTTSWNDMVQDLNDLNSDISNHTSHTSLSTTGTLSAGNTTLGTLSAGATTLGTLSAGNTTLSGTISFSTGTGPFCIFMTTCPSGWVDNLQAGFIYNRDAGSTCPYLPAGGNFGSGWWWCHPHLCCNS